MSTKKEEKPQGSDPSEIHSFSVLVAKIDDGCLHAELTDEVRDLLKKLDEHSNNFGKAAKGEITLKIQLTVENGFVTLGGDVKTKAPPPRRGRSAMYLTKGWGLSHKNQKQPDLPFQEVPRTTDAPKEAKSAEQKPQGV